MERSALLHPRNLATFNTEQAFPLLRSARETEAEMSEIQLVEDLTEVLERYADLSPAVMTAAFRRALRCARMPPPPRRSATVEYAASPGPPDTESLSKIPGLQGQFARLPEPDDGGLVGFPVDELDLRAERDGNDVLYPWGNDLPTSADLVDPMSYDDDDVYQLDDPDGGAMEAPRSTAASVPAPMPQSRPFLRPETDRARIVRGFITAPLHSVYDRRDMRAGPVKIPVMAKMGNRGWRIALRISSSDDFNAMMHFITRTGIFLELDAELGVGQRVDVLLAIEANGDRLPLSGQVDHESEAGAALAVRPDCDDFVPRWNRASIAITKRRRASDDSSLPGRIKQR